MSVFAIVDLYLIRKRSYFSSHLSASYGLLDRVQQPWLICLNMCLFGGVRQALDKIRTQDHQWAGVWPPDHLATLSAAAPLCGRARAEGATWKWPLHVIRLRSQVMDFTLSCPTLYPNCKHGALDCECVCALKHMHVCAYDIMGNRRLNFSVSVKQHNMMARTQRRDCDCEETFVCPLFVCVSLSHTNTHFPLFALQLSDHPAALTIKYSGGFSRCVCAYVMNHKQTKQRHTLFSFER